MNVQNKVSRGFLNNIIKYFKLRKEIINYELKLNKLEKNSNKEINPCK